MSRILLFQPKKSVESATDSLLGDGVAEDMVGDEDLLTTPGCSDSFSRDDEGPAVSVASASARREP